MSVRIVPVALATLALASPALGAPARKADAPAPQKKEITRPPLLDLSRWLDDRFRDLGGAWDATGSGKRIPPASSEPPPCYEIDRTKCPIG